MLSKDEKKPPQDNNSKEDESNTKRIESQTFYEKLIFLKSNITIEPIFACFVIACTVSRLAIQNLNLDKACRVKLRLGDEICDSVINKKENSSYYEGETQKVIAAIETWRSVIMTAIPTILVIFMGAWSDKTGNRKVCVLIPVVGEFIASVCNMLSTYFFYEISVESTMILESIFPALTGGWVMMYLGAFSYISDVTDKESRTYRVGMANLCISAGVPIGTALSGILLKLLGYYGIFTISGTIYLLAFLYGVVYLNRTSNREANVEQKPASVKFSEILSLVKETAAVVSKKRSGNQRSKLITTLLIVSIVYGPTHGERIITYMFTRYRLKWDGVMYSMFSSYNVIIHCIGALFSISVFSKRWGFHDTVLCIISITSKMVGSVLHNFVTKDWHMFMVPLVEILNSTTFTSLRSMASKMVDSEEMGKMNSLFNLVETLAALVFDPTYSALYSRTVKTHTGAVYLFSALMTLPPICMLTLLFLQYRRETKQNISWNPANWCKSPLEHQEKQIK